MPHRWLIIGSQILGPYEFYFKKAFEDLGHSVDYLNATEIELRLRKSFDIISQVLRYNFYMKRALATIRRRSNEMVFDQFKAGHYDRVFIYNDGNVFPDTIRRMQRDGAMVILLLADDPMFIRHRPWFMQDVLAADVVLSPDDDWMQWMRMLGQRNVHRIIGGSPPDVFHPVEPTEADRAAFGADVLFVGRNYNETPDGFYRAAILDALTDLDSRIFTSGGWNGIFDHHPRLRQQVITRSLSLEELNAAHSTAKITLALSNSGVRSGLFTRIFDIALSGGFVLAEHRSGIDQAYPPGLITQFHSIDEMRALIAHFASHDDERRALAQQAREFTLQHFTIRHLADHVLSLVSP